MKKIMIIGPSGSGKSTFSRKMSNILNIPSYHLDNIWWKEDKTHITRDEFDIKLKEILIKDNWIIDGDYSRTYEIRMEYSDTIIFLDYPIELCLKSAEDRIGTKRSDIPFIENEFDPEFKEFILSWRETTLPKLLASLEKYKDNKNILIFKNREEANNYLKNLK